MNPPSARLGAKKNAPGLGAAVGGLIGALWAAFTGFHFHNPRKSWWMRSTTLRPLSYHRVSRLARIGLGATLGAAVGGGVGYGVKRGWQQTANEEKVKP